MAGAPFRFSRTVSFGDTDMAGMVHFSRLMDYVEEAEHALFLQAGIPVIGSGSLWPRVRVEADFLSPAAFGDTVTVELGLGRVGKSSIRFDFQILRQEAPVCKGTWVICHSLRNERGGIDPAPVPREWVELLERHAG
jgi:YbgC/YbaW family acyl-CoA thioester hydrolase